MSTFLTFQVGGGGGTSQFSAPTDGGNKLALPESRGLGEPIRQLSLRIVFLNALTLQAVVLEICQPERRRAV